MVKFSNARSLQHQQEEWQEAPHAFPQEGLSVQVSGVTEATNRFDRTTGEWSETYPGLTNDHTLVFQICWSGTSLMLQQFVIRQILKLMLFLTLQHFEHSFL